MNNELAFFTKGGLIEAECNT